MEQYLNNIRQKTTTFVMQTFLAQNALSSANHKLCLSACLFVTAIFRKYVFLFPTLTLKKNAVRSRCVQRDYRINFATRKIVKMFSSLLLEYAKLGIFHPAPKLKVIPLHFFCHIKFQHYYKTKVDNRLNSEEREHPLVSLEVKVATKSICGPVQALTPIYLAVYLMCY